MSHGLDIKLKPLKVLHFDVLLLLQLMKSLLMSKCKILCSVKCSLSFSPPPHILKKYFAKLQNVWEGRLEKINTFTQISSCRLCPMPWFWWPLWDWKASNPLKHFVLCYYGIYKIAVISFCQGKTRNLFFRNPRREPPASCRSSFQICPSSFPCSMLRLCWCRCHISHKLQKQVAWPFIAQTWRTLFLREFFTKCRCKL